MKLTVGIAAPEPGWEMLLQQVGIDWKQISPTDELSPGEFSAIILNTLPDSRQVQALKLYLDGGGAVLAVNGSARGLSASKYRSKYFTSLPPDQSGNFGQSEMLDIYAPGLAEGDAARGKPASVGIHQVGKGILAHLPFDVNQLLLDTRSRRKNFYFRKDRLPSEIVATVSKGNLRRLVAGVLQFLHLRRGVPFVHKWYFPEAEESIFTFRIDTDKGSQEEIDRLFALCEGESVPAIWFLDTKSHEAWLGRFRDFGAQQVGIHCYRHLTYSTYKENLKNLCDARSLLENAGIRPEGASAPYGTWNPGIARSYESLGVSFSSEFSLDYDSLPFFPYFDGKFSSVLQIPIHPICVGSMNRAGYTSEEMKEYFRRIIDKKILEREPICLYHHPTHRQWDVIRDVFEYVRSKRIRTMSYAEYAKWWQTRGSVQTRLEYDEQKIRFFAGQALVWWRIVFPDASEAILQPQDVIRIDSIQRRPLPRLPATPADIGRTRRFDIRHPIMNALDAWYKRSQ